jgi:hypothetical protein
MAQRLILLSFLISIMCQLSQQMPAPEPNNKSMNETYLECKSMTSRCFGMPSDCLAKQNCEVLLSSKPTKTGADFVLYWVQHNETSGQDRWLGAALSENGHMGDASVTECLLWKNHSVTVRQGVTQGHVGIDTVEPVKGITEQKGVFKDNVVTCSWSRDAHTMVKNLDFDIVNKKYHIMLAYGRISDGNLQFHSAVTVSTEAVYLGGEIHNSTVTPSAKPSTLPSNI